MLCQVLGRKSEGCQGARCREVRNSLSDGKEAERALLDSPKMTVPGRRMQDISSSPEEKS